jgi:signal transduction histidine kinase
VRPSLAEDLPAVLADPGHVQQVLLNLILNALEAMPTGGRLGIRTRRAADPTLGDCVCISVQDTGPGIDAKKVDQLFEPFFTTREKGTGLGLFISRKLVTANKGDIRVRGREGGGTSFDVFLPAAAHDATTQDGSAS